MASHVAVVLLLSIHLSYRAHPQDNKRKMVLSDPVSGLIGGCIIGKLREMEKMPAFVSLVSRVMSTHAKSPQTYLLHQLD